MHEDVALGHAEHLSMRETEFATDVEEAALQPGALRFRDAFDVGGDEDVPDEEEATKGFGGCVLSASSREYSSALGLERCEQLTFTVLSDLDGTVLEVEVHVEGNGCAEVIDQALGNEVGIC